MSAAADRTVTLPSGETVPALGQGTWYIGDHAAARTDEIAALRRGLDLGMSLIDTAEMYGSGRSEDLVGEAIAGRRDEVFLVSKVLPSNASRSGTIKACEQSLKRLKTDRLDLYLLHWPGSYPLAETLAAFESLREAGKIRHFGVSNFDAGEMEDLWTAPGGQRTATNQVLYNLTRRGIEWDLLPWSRSHGVPLMAYSPIEQGRLLRHPAVCAVAERHDATAAQVALAWVLRYENVIAIPKSGRAAHVDENHGALDLRLSDADLADLDRALPSPDGSQPLEIL